MQDTLIMIGRFGFTLVFLFNGLGHLAKREQSAAYARKKGVSNPDIMVLVSGVGLVAGSLGVVLGIWTDIAFLGLGALALIMAFTMHPFWKYSGGELHMEIPNFMKAASLAGAALMGFALHAYGYEARQLVGPLLDLS